MENTQKTIEKMLKEQTDEIGKIYREKVASLKERNTRKTSLIADFLVQLSKPQVGSGSTFRLAWPTVVIDDEKEDKSIPSFSVKRKASAAKLPPQEDDPKSRASNQGKDFSPQSPSVPHIVAAHQYSRAGYEHLDKSDSLLPERSSLLPSALELVLRIDGSTTGNAHFLSLANT